MKYVLLLITVAVVYLILTRSGSMSPAESAVNAMNGQEAATLSSGPRGLPAEVMNTEPDDSSTPLKKPFDKTHAVLDQVKKRNGDGEF